MISYDLLKDPKWKQISSSAKVLYIYLRSKFNPKEQTLGEVSLAYAEMKGIMNTATMSKGLKELQREGFIEKTSQGGLFGNKNKFRFKGEHKYFYYKKKKV